MRFLSSSGGDDNLWGVLTTPAHNGIAAGVRDGKPWAADNQAFTKGFRPDVFFPWLKSMEVHRDSCLWVAVPDVVGDAAATLDLFERWRGDFAGWPVAFVAQDGQEDLELPDGEWDCLFVGGSTEWKESQAAVSVIRRAQALGKRIHIGRVNWGRRYRLFQVLDGSENFTCDGTRQRFEGKERAHAAWNQYQQQKPLITI